MKNRLFCWLVKGFGAAFGARARRGVRCVGFCLAAVLGSGVCVAHASTLAPLIRPVGDTWLSGAGFEFDQSAKKSQKTRQSVSGIACVPNDQQQHRCLVVFDEGVQARLATLGAGELIPDPQPVRFKGLVGELDAEAAATDGRVVYITGSHAVKRADCASNPDSRWVIRAPWDTATGRVLADRALATPRLWQVLQQQPDLAPFVGRCLGGQQGLNIEGLALHNGRLLFGFRGPVVDGVARVLSLNAQALFDGGDAQPAVTRLALGAHLGIRDMVAVAGGVLLLAGPDDDDASAPVGWSIFWWDGQASAQLASPRPLARLDLGAVRLNPCDKRIKPEAITVLEESARQFSVLVLSDGRCDGGALRFDVPR